MNGFLRKLTSKEGENQNKKKFEKTVEEMRRRFFGDINFGIRLFCGRGNPRFIFRFRSRARSRGGKRRQRAGFSFRRSYG